LQWIEQASTERTRRKDGWPERLKGRKKRREKKSEKKSRRWPKKRERNKP
jgi:hypothetical protein